MSKLEKLEIFRKISLGYYVFRKDRKGRIIFSLFILQGVASCIILLIETTLIARRRQPKINPKLNKKDLKTQ